MIGGTSLRGFVRHSDRRFQDAGWVGPLIGAVGGFGLAVALQYIGPTSSASATSATVQDSRGSIWSALALLFTGLSIVLAVVTLTAQNTSNQFSPRLLRIVNSRPCPSHLSTLRLVSQKFVRPGLAMSGTSKQSAFVDSRLTTTLWSPWTCAPGNWSLRATDWGGSPAPKVLSLTARPSTRLWRR